jgi:hypothetical protein
MGSKPGGIFGAIANMEQNIRDEISPVAKVLDPIGNFVVNTTNDFTNKPWLDLRNASRQGQQVPQAPAPVDPSQASTANAPKASSGASVSGGGAKDMATMPPNTPEGNRMRFGQTTLLGTTQ